MRRQGCIASDWDTVFITDQTDISRIRNVIMSGEVRIGIIKETKEKNTGIYNASIERCSIGDNPFIHNIGAGISNCIIGKNAVIENTASIAFDEESLCGVGTAVSVLDETGSRQVRIYPGLSSQAAALAARLPQWSETRLTRLVEEHVGRDFEPKPLIGDNVTVRNCGTILNVRIDDNVAIDGAARLCNGSIVNNAIRQPMSSVGCGVDAENFIIEDGTVDGGTILRNVYVGQGASLDKGFTAHDSLFFANCTLECGEACALFAGPYTVSMHKSTLLIGAMTSFMNAGSATNQSNHMYKLGPRHWGIMERGVKTSSGSYIMWGGRIGAFSLLMGQHKSHPDSSEFPFSYLIGNDKGETTLVPAVMLRSCGLLRDGEKWPERDRRLKREMRFNDRINFGMFNPVTIGKMLGSIRLADELLSRPDKNGSILRYKGMLVSRQSLDRAKKLYSLAIRKYVYEKTVDFPLPEAPAKDTGDWVDLSGQIMPREYIGRVCDSDSVEEIERIFDEAFADYSILERQWIDFNLKDYISMPEKELRESKEEFDRMVKHDQEKYLKSLSEENDFMKL